MEKHKINLIIQNPPQQDSRSKSKHFDSFIGVSKPNVNDIWNPVNVSNKGSSSNKRIKIQKYITITTATKDPRGYTFCNKKITPNEKRDQRNRPLRKELERKKNNW